MNVFDCAIKIEEETAKYYEGLQAEARQPELKNLFALLAASEKEHRNRLMSLRSAIPAERAGVDDLEVAACTFRPNLSQSELLSELDNDPDLYKFTVREEEQEIRFFEKLASLSKDRIIRKSLQMVANEERKHLRMVENIYDFVEAPKTFLAWAEFSNLHEL